MQRAELARLVNAQRQRTPPAARLSCWLSPVTRSYQFNMHIHTVTAHDLGEGFGEPGSGSGGGAVLPPAEAALPIT